MALWKRIVRECNSLSWFKTALKDIIPNNLFWASLLQLINAKAALLAFQEYQTKKLFWVQKLTSVGLKISKLLNDLTGLEMRLNNVSFVRLSSDSLRDVITVANVAQLCAHSALNILWKCLNSLFIKEWGCAGIASRNFTTKRRKKRYRRELIKKITQQCRIKFLSYTKYQNQRIDFMVTQLTSANPIWTLLCLIQVKMETNSIPCQVKLRSTSWKV